MKKEVTPELLEEAKNYLDITWDDAETNKKLEGILKRGITYIDEKGGADLEYESGSREFGLLLDYARYARENALHEFEENYRHDLLALQIDRQLKEA